MKVEGTGKTIVEAQADALAKLEELIGPFDRSEVEVVVIAEGSKGFLGMGSAVAKVEAWMPGEEDKQIPEDLWEEEPEEEINHGNHAAPAVEVFEPAGAEAEARLEDYLSRVLTGLGLPATVTVADEYESLVGNITGDDLGLFIGRHGQTIDAVQYLANIIVFRGLDTRKRVVVDAEDYRERREDVLKSLAERGANEVLRGKRQYELKPMSAAERRIVHLHLQDRDDVETISEGKEPFRRVIITRGGNS
jgi:spoIIIJ-associated protein